MTITIKELIEDLLVVASESQKGVNVTLQICDGLNFYDVLSVYRVLETGEGCLDIEKKE